MLDVTVPLVEVWLAGAKLGEYGSDLEALKAASAHADTLTAHAPADVEYEIRREAMKYIVHRRIVGPDAPALGPVLTISSTALTLTLDRPASGPTTIDRYEIEQLVGSTWTQIASGLSIFGSTDEYAVTGLTASTSYSFRCRAVDTTERASEYSYSSGTTGAGVANQAPVWQSPINLTLQQGSSVSIAQYASDPNGDQLTFAKVSSSPSAANIVLVSGPGVLQATTACPVGVYVLTVSANDGLASTNGTITLTVTAASTGTNWDITTGTATYDASAVQPGDTITILRGTGTRPGLRITNIQGTVANPITVRGDQTGVVTIRRSAPQQNGGFVLEFQNCRNFTVNGYLASGTRNCGIKVMYATGANSGNRDNPSQWVKFSGSSTLGATYSGCRNYTVKYVHVDAGWPTYSNLGSAFYIHDLRYLRTDSRYQGSWLENIVFEYNYVQRIYAAGMYLGPNFSENSIPVRNIIIRYNRVEDAGGPAFTCKCWWEGTNAIYGNVGDTLGVKLDGTANTRSGINLFDGVADIYNNQMLHIGAGNIVAAGKPHGIWIANDGAAPGEGIAGYGSYTETTAEVWNNVLADIAQDGLVTYRATGKLPVNIRAYNNTIVGCGESGIQSNGNNGDWFRNNIVIDCGAALSISSPATQSNNLTTGTPSSVFVAPELDNYHLAAEQSAVGTPGTDIASTDIDGTSRSGTASKGAYEYS